MTKTDEVKLLDQTIARFGPDSYLGPWLAEYRHQLVADIQNDLPPSAPMPSVARREAAEIVAAADRRSTALIDAAEARAKTTESVATLNIQRYREDVARMVRRALAELER